MHTQENYPPVAVTPTPEAIPAWLNHYGYEERYIALINATVVGHIQLVPSEEGEHGLTILTAELGLPANTHVKEVARLFTSLDYRHMGVGETLLNHAVAKVENTGGRATLCVNDSQTSAINLYLRTGWVPIGTYTGAYTGEPVLGFLH